MLEVSKSAEQTPRLYWEKKGKIEGEKCIPKRVKDESCMCEMIFPRFVALYYNITKHWLLVTCHHKMFC